VYSCTVKSQVTKTGFFKKKPKPVQTDQFQSGSVIFGKKPVQTNLARFFLFWLGFFFSLARFFSGLGLVRFFWFQAYKTETEPVGFFKTLVGFFSRFNFFDYFFPVFMV